MLARSIGALNDGGDQRAPLLHVAAVQHRAQRRFHPRERDVGQKTEPSLIDADQRHVERREPARERQHRAVATQHDRQIGGATDRRRVDGGQLRMHRQRGRLRLEHDGMTAIGQKLREADERLRQRRAAGAPNQDDAGETCGRARRHGRD